MLLVNISREIEKIRINNPIKCSILHEVSPLRNIVNCIIVLFGIKQK